MSLRNNILWVEAGYDISVAADSQVGFQSDYNDLYTTGSGKIGPGGESRIRQPRRLVL